jgi:hypothetical protein
LDQKGVVLSDPLPTDGGLQKLNFISEPNLYRVIFRSDKPEAVKFQDWVFNEVLPTLRKEGKYELGGENNGNNNTLAPNNTTDTLALDTKLTLTHPMDKDGFYPLILYLTKLRYTILDDTVFFLLNDIDAFLEVTKLNGIDKERTANNYTIHNILCDYNIIPYGHRVNSVDYLFLNLPQLLEFCNKFKSKRSELLQYFLECNVLKHRNIAEIKGPLTITA